MQISKEELKFSHQGQIILKNMCNFDLEDFKNWWITRITNVGSGDILEYLSFRDQIEKSINKE